MASLTTRISKVLQQEFVEGTVYRVDLDRVDVAPDGSSGILRSLPLTGDRDKIKPGDPVKIITIAGERVALAGDVAFSDGAEDAQVADASEIVLMETLNGYVKGETVVQGTTDNSNSGSTTDADTVDGKHAADFYLKTDQVNAATLGGLSPAGYAVSAHILSTSSFGEISVPAIAGSQTTWARLTYTGNWSIGQNNAWVTHPFNTASENHPANFVSQIGASRLVCKVAGTYIITANVAFESNLTGDRGIKIGVNGAEVAMQLVRAISTSGYSTVVNIAVVYPLAIDNYVELAVFQNSGNAALTTRYMTYYSPTLAFARIP